MIKAREGFFLNLGVLLRSAFLYFVFIAFACGWLPWYVLVLCNIIFYPAIYLHIHDLSHGAPLKDIWFTSRHPLVADPIWGGLLAFRNTHNRHHRYFGTYTDPWLPYYNGHCLSALVWNVFESEYNGYQYYREKGMNRQLITSILINVTMLSVHLVFFGAIYWIHVLSQRFIRAIAIFFFNYYTHRSSFRADSDFGVYERAEDMRHVLPAMRFLWGRVLLNGIIYHNRHHSINNWSAPVKDYERLEDEKVYTKYHKDWPAKEIRHLNI